MPVNQRAQKENALTPAADLAHRDSRLPGLALLLDPQRLMESLGGQLDTSRIEAIRLDYLRYKPGMNCLARYRLLLDGETQIAYAKAHGLDAPDKIDKSTERPVIDGYLGPGRVVLDDRKIIFSTFPNDSKLVSLQLLGDPDSRRRLLGRVFGADTHWLTGSFGDALNYKPERRYVVRFEQENGKSALLKFYSESGYAKAYSISRKLDKTKTGSKFYPETIGRSKKYSIAAYGWKPGKTLRQLAVDGQLSPTDLASTAEALAEFHASSRRGLSLPGPDEQTVKLFALSDQLGFLLPGLHARAITVARTLANWLREQAPVKSAIHGDFYDKQVIVYNGKASLIDIDAARLGDPLEDLGNYIAHIERSADNQGVLTTGVNEEIESLIGAYEELTGRISRQRLDRYVAIGLFSLIHQPFRDWLKDWPVKTEQLLSRVEDLCSI